MMEIYFDNVLINEDYYTSLSTNFALFNDTFYLGSTAYNTFNISIAKEAVTAQPNIVTIKDSGVLVATLVVDKVEEDDFEYKYTLTDKMVDLEFEYDASQIFTNGSATLFEIAQDICNKAGITLATTNFRGYNKKVSWYDNTRTAREYIGYIAELNGGYAQIGKDGKLYFIKQKTNPVKIIHFDDCADFKIGEKHKITRVVYELGALKYEYGDETGNTLYLNSDNVYITEENEVKEIFNEINGFEFYSFNTSTCPIDYEVMAGQVIVFTDGINNYPTIAGYNLTYNGDWYGGYELNVATKKQEETQVIGTDKKIKNLSIKVDRDKNEIITKIESVESQVTDITTTQATLEGTEIKIDDGAEEPIIKLEVDGHSEQTVWESKNFIQDGETVKSSKNSYITYTVDFQELSKYAGQTIYVSFDAKTDVAGALLDIYFRSTGILAPQSEVIQIDNINDFQRHYTEMTVPTNLSDYTQNTFAFRNNAYVEGQTVNDTATITYKNVQIELNEFTEFREYNTSSPSPEFPSEIQSVGDDVNLFDIEEVTYRGGDTDVVIENNKIILTATGTVGAQMAQKFIHNLNANENYTFSFKAKKTTLGTDGHSYISVSIYGSNDEINYTSLGNTGSLNKSPEEGKEYYFSRTVTGYTSYRFYIYNNASTPVTVGEQTEYYDIKFQKGTATTPYSEYGKGTVEIKQCGKNLLNYKSVSNTSNTIVSLIENGFNVKGMYAGKVVINNLQKNTDYYLQYLTENIIGTAKNVVIFAGTSQTTKIKEFTNGIGGTFNTGENTEINIWFYASKGSSENEVNFTNIQLELGSIETTEYEPYKENNYVIPLSQPLRSLPNGVCDTIEEDGIHRRVGSATVNISYIVTLSNENIGGVFSLTNKIANYEENVICSKAVAIRSYEENTVYVNTTNVVFVGNPTDTLETIKEKFDGAEIIYELAEEVIEPFDEEQQAVIDSIKTMLGTQYFTCDANMRITYVRDNGLSDMYETKQNAIKKYAQQEMKLTETGALIESLVSVTNALNDGFKVGDETLQKQLETLGEELQNYQLTTSTSFEQTEKNFQMKFNELIESINTNAEGNSEKFAEIVKYIRFEDGNIVLGRSDNQLILKIQNDRISYQQNGVEVAYFSNNQLYVTRIKVLERFDIGDFSFVLEENGSLSLELGGGE